MGVILYCATPSRMYARKEEFKERARKDGFVPFHPGDICPREEWEDNPDVGRDRTLRFTKHMQIGCDETGIFGISDGTLKELKNAIDHNQPVRLFPEYDPLWNQKYEELREEHGDLLGRLRGPHTLIAFIGVTAVGKTFWIDKLLERLPNELTRVKNTTTRMPRDQKDLDSYNFISRETFEKGIKKNKFLEHTVFRDEYYGSSFEAIREVLKKGHGVFALTPDGADALAKHHLEFNLRFIVLKPVSWSVLLKNLLQRNITDSIKQKEAWRKVKECVISDAIPHSVIELEGNEKADEPKILSAVESIFSQKR